MMEAYRERRPFDLIETTARDIRYALRTLRKSHGYALTSMAVLALAIGGNTAMFSVLDAVLLRPLPYESPEQLAMLWTEIPSQNVRQGRTAYWNFEQWRNQSKSFSELAAFDPASATLTGTDQAERISVVAVSWNLFGLLGMRPLEGRTFTAEEAAQRQRLVLISERFWRNRFASLPDAIGATIAVDGVPAQIIGILPGGFQFSDADMWEPHTLSPEWESARNARGGGSWFVLGRLQNDATFEQAQAEMSAIARRLDEQVPATERNRGISVVPLSAQVTGPKSRLGLWMLTGAVFCVLLIAASNVASLSLARGASREKEIAMRAALGASRTRIIRQLLAESLTLAFVSGALGLGIASAGIRLIVALKPAELPRLDQVALDPQVLACAMALCLVTGILVGVAPAISLSRHDLRSSFHAGGRGVSDGMAARGIRRALVVTEFALALVLLAGAGLLVRSLWSVQKVDLGFRPERVLSVALSVPTSRPAAQRGDIYSRVLEQIESIPGVESAGMTENLFIGGTPERAVTIEDVSGTFSEQLRFRGDASSSGFFRTLGTPLLRGRSFSREDGPDSPLVAIINDAMARRLWPGRDPVGRRFKLGGADSTAPWRTIVGVVGNMRRQGLENEPVPQMFFPLLQDPPRLATVVVRMSTDDPLRIAPAIQAAVRQIDKQVPVYGVSLLEQRLGSFLTERRFQTSLLIGFSIVALLMAAIGIYGLIQYSVATRTHEIGIRLAIGAQTGDVLRTIMREGLLLSLTGLVIGLAGALALGRAWSSLLFGVTSTDPLTLVAVSLLLTGVAAAACYFPSRRAMKVDPVVALRQD